MSINTRACIANASVQSFPVYMLLTIVELGYQSCWYEGHITDDDRICDKIAAVLNVPEDYDVVCILPVGKAADEFRAPDKKPFAERVHFNSWS